jgi:hypothetical protein
LISLLSYFISKGKENRFGTSDDPGDKTTVRLFDWLSGAQPAVA